MTNKPDLDSILRKLDSVTKKASGQLAATIVDYVRKLETLKFSEREAALPITDSVAWSRLNRFQRDLFFQQVLTARINEFAPEDLRYEASLERSTQNKIKGYLVVRSIYNPIQT